MRDYQSTWLSPTVDPGQIWLIEQNSESPLCAVDRNALTNVNAVIYDRVLAPVVAEVLPIGGYAEPLPVVRHATGPAISPRAVELAAEGWSAAQLIQPSSGGRSRLHILPPALVRAGAAADLPVRVIAKPAADRHRVLGVGLPELAEFLGEFGDDEPLTLVFGPFFTGSGAQPSAFAVNGLAG